MTTIERRREQNRLAQRRYRQRQQQSAAAASLYARLATDPVRIVPTPSHSAPTAAAAAAAIALPVGQPSQPQSEPSAYTFSYASPAVGKSKSFCDLITDGANLLLDGLGTIDMGDVELPSAFLAAHQPGSSRPSPTPAEVVEALSRSRVYARTPSSSSFATPADSVDPTHSGENARFADVDAETSADKEKGRRGKRWATPLHMAAGKGQDKIVRTLLQHNADCNQRDGDGFTPLMRAAAAGYRETVSLLLSHGARVDLVDQQSRSALHWATARKQEAVLRVLLEHGGGAGSPLVNKYDDDGMTPLHVAVDHGFDAGVQLLLRFGASVHG